MSSSALFRSPLQAWHRAHGARLAEADGWETPAVYTAPEKESAAAKTSLALADLSSFAKLAVRGPGVANWIAQFVGNGPVSKPLGVSRLDSGVLVCRLTADQILLLASSPTLALGHGEHELRCSALEMHFPAATGNLLAINQTSALAGFSLVGHGVAKMLRHLTHLEFPPLDSCVQTRLAGVTALLIRTQELSVPSLRIYVTCDLGEYLWESLMEAGDVLPLGLDGWRSLLA